MAVKIVIYPTVPQLQTQGVTITDAALVAALPQPLRAAERVIVDEDNRVLAGIPAVVSDADGAALRASLEALPALTAALSAYAQAAAASETAAQAKALDDATKAECGRRIMAVLKDDRTQLNITGLSVDLVNRKLDGETLAPTDEADLEMASALKAWVAAMQAKRRDLRDSGDATFAQDSHWPAAPAGAVTFAARF